METMATQKSAEPMSKNRFWSEFCGVTIRNIMSRDVVTATVDETILSVAKKMAEDSVSCVVVAEDKRTRGIFTERDLVRCAAYDGDGYGTLTVSQRMSSPVKTVALDAPVLDAAAMMEANGIKRLPVVAGGRIVGIVTQTDITRGLVLLTPLRSVSDIMPRDLATVEAQDSVAEAARLMSERHISSVVVVRHGCPVAMLTEKDVTKRVISAKLNPRNTVVAEVMSFPLQSVPPTYSVLSANQKMSALRIRRLVVIDGGEAIGIVTQTDIMRSVRTELERMDADRVAAWSAITDHIQRIRGEVVELGEFFQGCLGEFKRCDTNGAAEKRGQIEAEITKRIDRLRDDVDRLQVSADLGPHRQAFSQSTTHADTTEDGAVCMMG